MKNFRLTLKQKYGYANIFFGASFVLMALFIKSGNIYLSMSSTLLNLVAVLGLLLTFFLKSDIDDERALDNFHRAAYRSLMLTLSLISALLFIMVLINITVDTDTILRIILGISLTLYGYFFLQFERE